MAAWVTELRFQQLEARLASLEQALGSLQRAAPADAESPIRHLETLQKELEDGGSVSSSELLETHSERFEEALFTSAGDEIRAGITTKGPCYELQHSVWDTCIFIGLPALSTWDSLTAAFLFLLNIMTQVGFVIVVRNRMLEDILQPEQLTELLRFRTNVAHAVKYADLVGGRSMARQVCAQDESLQWANAQSSVISDLNDYLSVGPALALLAIGCWLSTTLKELFNVLGFGSAIRKYPVGDTTELSSGEGDEDVGEGVSITQISRRRKYVLYVLVCVPRMAVAVMLAITGTRYLANTLSLSDLILNAVALAFILDLDELVESAFMPRRARFLLDALGTLPIPRLEIPGVGNLRGGMQERVKNFVKIALLILGLVLTWCLLLQPLHDRVRLAHNILCSGRQDFIYTVNSATGLIEAAKTFEEDVPLTSQQKSVLRLTGLNLFAVQDWFSQDEIDDFKHATKIGVNEAVLHQPYGEDANMGMLFQLLMLDKSDVAQSATRLPCADTAFAPGLVRERLRYLTNDTVDSCEAVAKQSQLCADPWMNSVRALCPQTCGCNNPIDPAAGAFATVPFGCPKMCITERDVSPKLMFAPCTDWTEEQLVASDYMKRFFQGLFTAKLGKEEVRKAAMTEYKRALNTAFHDLLPGPNRTQSLLEAVEFYGNGGWHHALAEGNYELGLGIPHPRGLTGCAFLNSDEVKAVAGGSICSQRTDVDLVKSLRAQCPVTCGCRKGERQCPGTCPANH